MDETKSVPKLRFSGFRDDWESMKIGDCLDVKYGKDYKHLNEGQYPLLGTGGVMEYVDDFLYSGESILIGRKGTIDKPKYINDSFWTVDTLFYTEIKKQFPKFLFYCISNINWLKYNEASGVPSLSANNIKSVKINVPSLNEQKKIANFITSIDYKIELLEKKYESYVNFKKYLMQQIFAQKLRFDENCQYATKKVKDFLVESKIEGTDDINKRLTVKLNLKGITIRESKTIEIEGATKQFIRKSGQFIYGKQNLHKGAFGIVPKELDGYLTSSDIPSFDFKGEIKPKWFYYYFSRKSFYEKLESLSTGTGSKRISPKEFLNIKIIVPEIEEQHRIVYLLEKFDEKINGISNQITQMDLFKKSLLQQMFNNMLLLFKFNIIINE